MDKLYYTIGEVAKMLGVNASALRYYEERFSELRPSKNSRGVRRYTQADIDLLQRIVDLTRDGNYTLEGVREQLRTKTEPAPAPAARQTPAAAVSALRQVRDELAALRDSL